jgi:hypothetical protein
MVDHIGPHDEQTLAMPLVSCAVFSANAIHVWHELNPTIARPLPLNVEPSRTVQQESRKQNHKFQPAPEGDK